MHKSAAALLVTAMSVPTPYPRPLYDRYGLRVDYGETEWPSVWPSEIQQDELRGWTLVQLDPTHEAAAAAVAAATSTSTSGYRYLVPPVYHGQTSTGSGDGGWSKHVDESGYEFYYHKVCAGLHAQHRLGDNRQNTV